ncbi:hypothetical protein AVEN_176391-1 [Araneus ventricosus]|uniref:Uncharacterized protein n=1 Tax=Araneus ventricosus TaxID=182803 RepID=A0A4Y2C9Y6_ARAVE|nr:hypothetical protein AVEN_176391-1 [Araneus ventricosus]
MQQQIIKSSNLKIEHKYKKILAEEISKISDIKSKALQNKRVLRENYKTLLTAQEYINVNFTINVRICHNEAKTSFEFKCYRIQYKIYDFVIFGHLIHFPKILENTLIFRRKAAVPLWTCSYYLILERTERRPMADTITATEPAGWAQDWKKGQTKGKHGNSLALTIVHKAQSNCRSEGRNNRLS